MFALSFFLLMLGIASHALFLKELTLCKHRLHCGTYYPFTTQTPAVTDVLVSGRNVGALRLARRVGFW